MKQQITLPLHDFCLLSQNLPDKHGELYLPEGAKQHYITWNVVECGPKVNAVEKGSEVIVRPQSNIYECGENRYLVREDDIIAIQAAAVC